ncbi:MAG TPA: trypsin-like peptidase domain-containing protein, partial [Candidatus Acidoferrales bacterium]|nr:trypsin-like peptidase domain-containing protein [Candidatus Acidoferrales bacterium]
VSELKTAVSVLESTNNITYQSITILPNENGTSLTGLYAMVKDSVVLILGETSDGSVQGSGFAYNYQGRNVIITNNHVVEDTTTLSVTFSNGKGYYATILGTDPYADLAVLAVPEAPASEFKAVTIISSSALSVGETVIAIGNPYGLVGSMTTGIVSAVGRSITEDTAGGYAIANVIQTNTAINPGNSGGLLLNAMGNVVGITTAIVSDSQGLGFAIPSSTILREIGALIADGTFRGHSYLGVTGTDMSYDIAMETGNTVTYGWKIASIANNGPSAGKLQVDDIIIAMNGQIIKSNDDLASYLEAHTLPGDSLRLTVIRDKAEIFVDITLGVRPAAT